jgi:hypothetical protein
MFEDTRDLFNDDGQLSAGHLGELASQAGASFSVGSGYFISGPAGSVSIPASAGDPPPPGTTTNYTNVTNNFNDSTENFTNVVQNFSNVVQNFLGLTTINVFANTNFLIVGPGAVIVTAPWVQCGWLFWCHKTYAVTTFQLNNWPLPAQATVGETIVWRMTSQSDWVLTGMDHVGNDDGQVVVLVNASTHVMTIANNSAASGPGLRFLLQGGADDVVGPDGERLCWWDSDSEAWRVLGGGGGADIKVKVDPADTTAGFLADGANGKLIAGTGITFVKNNVNANETVTINATGGGGTTPASAGNNSVGSVTNSSHAYAQCAGTTLTTNGGNLLVCYSCDMNVSGNGTTVQVRVKLDGVVVGTDPLRQPVLDQGAATAEYYPFSFTMLLSAVGATSHTITIENLSLTNTLIVRNQQINVIEII